VPYWEINWNEENKQICINHREWRKVSFENLRYSLIHLNEMQMRSVRRPLKQKLVEVGEPVWVLCHFCLSVHKLILIIFKGEPERMIESTPIDECQWCQHWEPNRLQDRKILELRLREKIRPKALSRAFGYGVLLLLGTENLTYLPRPVIKCSCLFV